MKQKIVWMPALFAVMILSILLMNHRKTEMMRSGHVFESWDMHEKNINAAARRLAETVNNDPGDGSAICGLFSKEQYDEVYSEASEFANAFTGKGEKIDHLYVDGTFPTIAVYTDEDDPGVAYTEYKELACVFTTDSDVYVATMTAVIGNNNTLAFKEIAVTANNMFHADPDEYKSISLLRTPPVFSYTDNDPGGYGGTRRMIGGQTFYWEETSAKVNAGEITTSDWEGKRTADDFRDTYGEPGFAYMADTDGGFMYYATETDGQYLRIGIDSNGLIREIGQETTVGVTRLRKVSLQPNTNENA